MLERDAHGVVRQRQLEEGSLVREERPGGARDEGGGGEVGPGEIGGGGEAEVVSMRVGRRGRARDRRAESGYGDGGKFFSYGRGRVGGIGELEGEGLEGLGEEGEAGFEGLDESLDGRSFGLGRRPNVAGRSFRPGRRGGDGVPPLPRSLEVPSQPNRLELHPTDLIDHFDAERVLAVAQVLLDVLWVTEDLAEVEDGLRDGAGAG